MRNSAVRPLPIAIEEIDRNWLTDALRRYAPDIEVLDFEIVRMLRGTCTKIWVRLALNDAGKRAGVGDMVVVKGGFEPHSRHMHYMHEKEVRAYRDLFPTLKLNIPTCYFADYDAERQQGIVILEDLNARNVTFCSALQPQSFEMVARRLGDLARYHAQSWNSPEFAPGGRWEWVDSIPSLQSVYFNQYLEVGIWARYIVSPRGAAASVKFHDRDWMIASLDRMARLSSRLPHCVIHCDTHLGNLYVEPDGTPGFFDSLAGRAPSLLEVGYHLVCALDTADRRRWEGPLIQHYLDELRSHGVEPAPFDEAMRHYAIFLAYAYCIFIINESVFQAEAVNTAYVARISAAMIDNRTAELLETVR